MTRSGITRTYFQGKISKTQAIILKKQMAIYSFLNKHTFSR